MKNVAIILINWNGWKDTCECLSSFLLLPEQAHFFIVDNNSSDSSVTHLEQFAKEKNISYRVLAFPELKQKFDKNTNLTIIPNTVNAGFARATNRVLQFVLQKEEFDYAWLLNNDTIVNKSTLPALLEDAAVNPGVTFWGSVILEYAFPDTVQSCGVHHHKYLGVSKLFLKGKRWDTINNSTRLKKTRNDYQNGASLFIKLSSLKSLGLMDEIFFLYSEEADWQLRAYKKGFSNKLSEKSIVYHKGSVSTLSRKHIFFFHYNCSAVLLTRKNFGVLASFTSTLALIIITVLRSRLHFKSILSGINGIINGWKIKIARQEEQ